MNVVVLHNQSLLDVCLQHTGSIEGMFELALANDLSVTEDVEAGAVLQLPEGIIQDKDILNYYTTKQIQPACGLTEGDWQMIEPQGGISIWAIGVDFIVS